MLSFKEEYENILTLCNSDEHKTCIKNTTDVLLSTPLVIYGAATLGVTTAMSLKKHGLTATCFCDKHKSGTQENVMIPIISPQTLKNDYSHANIIIASVIFKEEIRQEILALGISADRIFPWEFINTLAHSVLPLQEHIKGYERTYDLLADDHSKKILLGRVLCCILSFPFIPLEFLSDNLLLNDANTQYFDKTIISLTSNEVFIDAGMFTGDTAQEFFEQTNYSYKHYYGFEPETNNFKQAKQTLNKVSHATTSPFGLWSENCTLVFSDKMSSSSKIDINGNTVVPVIALDCFDFGDNIPTFIKMDIEGAELEALKGARQIIIDHKPKLAICAYHKIEDIYTLSDLIKSYRNDYTFYLRHYSQSIFETVLYAI